VLVVKGAREREAEQGPKYGLRSVAADLSCVPSPVVARVARAERRVNRRTVIFDAAVVLEDTCAIAGARSGTLLAAQRKPADAQLYIGVLVAIAAALGRAPTSRFNRSAFQPRPRCPFSFLQPLLPWRLFFWPAVNGYKSKIADDGRRHISQSFRR